MTHVILISSGNHSKKLRLMITHTVPWFPAHRKLKTNAKNRDLRRVYKELGRTKRWRILAIAVKVNEQMVPGTNRMQPIAKSNSQRIPGYDLARSLAIFGMVIVNYSSFMGGWGVGPGWLVWLVELLPGRAAAIFVVLAGVGMSLMARQGRDSDNRLEKKQRNSRQNNSKHYY